MNVHTEAVYIVRVDRLQLLRPLRFRVYHIAIAVLLYHR
jgi:hypothetical protein